MDYLKEEFEIRGYNKNRQADFAQKNFIDIVDTSSRLEQENQELRERIRDLENKLSCRPSLSEDERDELFRRDDEGELDESADYNFRY